MANTCKSCKAPIKWAKTRDGKITLMNAEPDDTGSWIFLDGEHVHYVPAGDREAARGKLFRAHWGSCPNPDAHRKVRK